MALYEKVYDQETYEEVMERVLGRVGAEYDKREGGIIFDATAPMSMEVALIYIALDYILQEGWADTATRKHLLQRAAEFGIYPKPAGYACLRAEFDIEIDIGERFSCDEFNYIVTEPIEEESQGELKRYLVRCEAIGAIGNRITSGDLMPCEGYINGLTIARLAGLLIPGEDDEETEHFRERFLASFSSQAFGGNRKDYIEKVMSIPGVGAVRVYPVWNHGMCPENMVPSAAVNDWVELTLATAPAAAAAWLRNVWIAAKNLWLTVGGTVKLVILDSEFNAASSVLVDDAQTRIDPEQNHGEGLGIAPIGHIVNVFPADEDVINVSMRLELAPGTTWADVRPDVEKAIKAYFKELAKTFQGETPAVVPLVVRQAHVIVSVMRCAGLRDVQELRINGTENNITLGIDAIPVIGEVTVFA